MECRHASIRAVNNGICVLCDDPAQLTYDQELAALREEERAAQHELAALDQAAMRHDLAEFVRSAWHVLEHGELEWNWHHDAFCANLQGLYNEYRKRKASKKYVMKWQKLLMNAAPSTLKSRFMMVFFVAWVWLDDPGFTWICTSINPRNVTRDSEDCNKLVSSEWYKNTFRKRPGNCPGRNVDWHILTDIDSKGKFQLSSAGERLSVGLHSKHSGPHVDGILIDDADDAMEVHSEPERIARAAKVESLMTRVKDKRCCFFIVGQQRVHVDDCTGELLARGGWLHANYPIEYHDGTRHDSPWYKDPRTKDGDVIQPDRFTTEVIAALRIELGEFGFEAQGNGNPSAMSGGMLPLPNWRFCQIDGFPIANPVQRPTGAYAGEVVVITRTPRNFLDIDWFDITVDATFGSIDATASNVGLLAICGKGIDRFCVDDRTKARDYVNTKQAIREMLADWAWAFNGTIRVLVEKKANGAAIVNELTVEFPGIIALEVEGGKEARAYAMSPDVDSGHCYVLDGAHWMPKHLAVVSRFPHAKTDDEVDAWSQCMAQHRAPSDQQKLLAKNAAFKQLAHARTLQMMRGGIV